jgi:hypothetical protein
MKKAFVIKFFLLALIFMMMPVNNAFSISSYRCGDVTVNTGNTIEEVIAKCGEPPSGRRVDTREVSGTYGGGAFTETAKDVETLVYNCGEGTIIHILTFKGGKLTEINTGDRGTGENLCK